MNESLSYGDDGPGLSESLSWSRSLMNGDLARLTSFLAPRESDRVLEFLLPLDIDADVGSSSMDVASVVVETREYVVMLLPDVLAVPVSVELRLSAVRERRWLFIEPPKKSPIPIPEPGLEPNRLREITSRPKMAARERDAVGVVGLETELPVLNLKRPNCWTGWRSVSKKWRLNIETKVYLFGRCAPECGLFA